MSKDFITSFIITFLFLSAGVALIHYGIWPYGIAVFVFLPFVLGYVLGGSRVRKFSIWGFVFSLIVFFILIYLRNVEGMICILLVFPIVAVMVSFGYWYYDISHSKKSDKPNRLKITILPIAGLLCFGFLEKEFFNNNKVINSVKTEIILPYSCIQVYDAIKSMDTLFGEKPFLMKLDLPVPNKCILENEAVGGKRICYFTNGRITEIINEIEKGKVLKMDIVEYNLTGRKWLGFLEAIYYFSSTPENYCKLTRITTYTSQLFPRMYWNPLEIIGIQQEHEYVFNNLILKLKNAKNDI